MTPPITTVIGFRLPAVMSTAMIEPRITVVLMPMGMQRRAGEAGGRKLRMSQLESMSDCALWTAILVARETAEALAPGTSPLSELEGEYAQRLRALMALGPRRGTRLVREYNQRMEAYLDGIRASGEVTKALHAVKAWCAEIGEQHADINRRLDALGAPPLGQALLSGLGGAGVRGQA